MNYFRSDTETVDFEAGAIIVRQGEPGETMFAVVEGEVEVVLGGRILETFGPGEFFGEMSLIDKTPRSADVRAKTRCRLAEVDQRRFTFMVQQTPYFAIEVMRSLTTRLRHRLAD